MRQLCTSIALLCLIASCGGDDKKTDDGTTDTTICTANTTVDCGDVPADQVDNQTFVKGLATASCAADGKSWDTSKCTAISSGTGEVYSACDLSGDDCKSGLTCVALYAGSDADGNDVTTGECFETCSATADCSDGEECSPSWAWFDPVCSQSSSERDEVCGYGYTCADGLECGLTIDYGQECKDVCPDADVGTTSVCTNGDKCLWTDVLVLQIDPSTSGSVSCTDVTDCDQGNGFNYCYDLGSGSVCMKFPAACGTEIAPFTDINDTYLDAHYNSSKACDLPGTSQFCGALTNANATATTSCTQFGGHVFPQESNGDVVSCTTDAECDFKAGYSCQELSDGNGGSVFECAVAALFCVAYCEDSSGDATGISCGDGLVCALAPSTNDSQFLNIYAYATQPDGDDAKTCSGDTDCNEADGFYCQKFSDDHYCIRPRKVCQAT